jgi:hypothetical protein
VVAAYQRYSKSVLEVAHYVVFRQQVTEIIGNPATGHRGIIFDQNISGIASFHAAWQEKTIEETG